MSNHAGSITRSSKPRRNGILLGSKMLLLLVAILSTTSSLYQIAPVSGDTIHVPTEFGTIQAAVDNATAGDTIQVASGVYYEHVSVNKSLTLVGENPQTTIVDGSADGTVFDLEGSNIHVSGFTIRNAGNYNAIKSEREIVTSDYHWIGNNIIMASLYGIYLSSSDRNTIFNNTFVNNAFGGIYLTSADYTNITGNTIIEGAYGIKGALALNNIIEGNTISQTSYAIYLSSSSTGNTIRGNVLSGRTAGVYSNSDSTTIDHNIMVGGSYGIYLYNCESGSIYYNTLKNNSYGIRLYCSSATTTSHTISNNKMQYIDWAIELVNSNGNTFTGNWMQQNTYGIYMAGSSSNTVYRNNFVHNNMPAYAGTGAGNVWDKNVPGEGRQGNYWSDYEGEDQDDDGIGDTPYRIVPVGYDNYPLMETWSEHDLLIANVSTSTNRTYAGSIVNVTVTVENIGKADVLATFNVTLKINELPVETKTVVDLAPEENYTLTFNWNTSETTPRINYTISVEVDPVPDELNIDNNNFVDGKIYVKLMGDVNDDGIVDIFDTGAVSAHWYPGPPIGPLGYDLECDLNGDGAVDIFDIGIVSVHWGETA